MSRSPESIVVIIRTFHKGDEQLFPSLVNTAYRNLETLTPERVKRLTSPPYFNPDGFFIAEKQGSPVGCVGVFNLPAKGCLWMGYLAVKEAFSNLTIVNGLIKTALKYCTFKKPRLSNINNNHLQNPLLISSPPCSSK